MMIAHCASRGSVSHCGVGPPSASQREVERPVQRVEDPEPEQGVGDVRDDRREVRRRPVARPRRGSAGGGAARAPSAPTQAQRDGEGDEHQRVAEGDPEHLVVQSSRKLSRPMKRGERMRSYSESASANVTSGRERDEHREAEEVRREHEREVARVAVAHHRRAPTASRRCPRRRRRRCARGGEPHGRRRPRAAAPAATRATSVAVAGADVDERLVAGGLDHLDVAPARRRRRRELDVLGPDARPRGCVRRRRSRLRGLERERSGTSRPSSQRRGQEVHRRAADEACDEAVRGLPVDLVGRRRPAGARPRRARRPASRASAPRPGRA